MAISCNWGRVTRPYSLSWTWERERDRGVTFSAVGSSRGRLMGFSRSSGQHHSLRVCNLIDRGVNRTSQQGGARQAGNLFREQLFGLAAESPVRIDTS